MKKPTVLVINGSLRGEEGNSHHVSGRIAQACAKRGAQVDVLVLASVAGPLSWLEKKILAAQSIIITTGCYWSSPGSVMQRFLEVATQWEVGPHFLGKPAGVVTTMHSVGGLEVARQVAGALQHMGCLLPPLGVMTLSRVAQMALAHSDEADIWRLSDVDVLCHNVLEALPGAPRAWASWPVARAPVAAGHYPAVGKYACDGAPVGRTSMITLAPDPLWRGSRSG